MNTEFFFVNHASLLIRYANQFLLTDPWHLSPAHLSWRSCPPMMISPWHLMAIAKKADSFSIVISHPHDDHCDDSLLKLFNTYPAIITAFESRPLRNRLKNIGFDRIIEVDSSGQDFNDFKISGFINKDLSLNDSIQVISSPDLSIVHANDNWNAMPDQMIDQIRYQLKNHTVLATQMAISDGFPLAYSNFSLDEKQNIVSSRTQQRIDTALNNAKKLGAKFLLQYAEFVKTFPISDANSLFGFTDPQKIISRLTDLQLDNQIQLLDMIPGDRFYQGEVVFGLARELFDINDLVQASSSYHNSSNSACINIPKSDIDDSTLISLLQLFSAQFIDFANNIRQQENYMPDIDNARLIFEIKDVHLCECKFPNFNQVDRIDLKICWDRDLAASILTKKIIWEHSYVGLFGNFEVWPKNLYNAAAVKYLSNFGHHWYHS